MKELLIHSQAGDYPVIIRYGLLNDLLQHLDQRTKYVIIHDDLIPDVYVNKVGVACERPLIIAFPAGEKNKSVETYQMIIRTMLDNQIRKDAVVIALGGGVTGDLAGYVASTYMRGIAYLQIPTSLLAQIDSSVGGKVGLDFADTKNIIGSIYPPKKVLIDPLTLETLPRRHFANGMSEMIKYGMIANESFFAFLRDNDVRTALEHAIARSIEIKQAFVEKDEFDSGERQILNFGHTYGHALEAYYGYEKYLHGEAVAIGMVRETRNQEIRKDLIRVLQKYGLPTEDPVKNEELKVFVQRDKKSRSGYLSVIDIESIGCAVIRKENL